MLSYLYIMGLAISQKTIYTLKRGPGSVFDEVSRNFCTMMPPQFVKWLISHSGTWRLRDNFPSGFPLCACGFVYACTSVCMSVSVSVCPDNALMITICVFANSEKPRWKAIKAGAWWIWKSYPWSENTSPTRAHITKLAVSITMGF